jgi:hypothetical protein
MILYRKRNIHMSLLREMCFLSGRSRMFKLIYSLDCLKLEDFLGRNIMLNDETNVQLQSHNL